MAVSGCKKDDADTNPDYGKLPPLPDKSDVCSAMDDTVFKNYCYENFDTDKDGKISESEYSAVKEINCDGLQIASFKGIEYFSNLEIFSCKKNRQIGAIDLSYNKAITTIGKSAFYECTGLTDIAIPDSVTTIDGYAFFYCKSLSTITIPNGVTTIGEAAFYDCPRLTSITIPCSVMSVGSQAFGACEGLTAFYGKFASADNKLLITDSTLFAFARAGLTEYTVPDNVTVIGANAFQDCTDLTKITIPDGVTTIGEAAFAGCFGLTNVIIPDSVTTIGNAAFVDCRGLTSITVGSSVAAIGDLALVFCTNLTSVYCKGTTPPILGDKILTYLNNNLEYENIDCSIYVPRASIEAYKSAATWSDYSSQIVAYDF